MKKIRLVTLLTAALLAGGVLQPLAVGSSEIDTSQEYVSDYLPDVWYTWINTLGTQLICIALHQEQYNSPVFAFLGQHYNTTNNLQVFVGNALTLMEVYNDTDGNGVLDANYMAGKTELKYYLLVNSSKSFEPSPVRKTEINGVVHFKWGVTYGEVDGFLLYPHSEEHGYGWWEAAADVMIDHLGLFYDYSIEENETYVKTSYRIGNVTLLERKGSEVTINGMSLSLLYTTQVISPKKHKIIINNKPFNSKLDNPGKSVDLAEIKVENTKAYEFRFKDNYTLYQEPPTQHPTNYSACPTSSVQPQLFKSKLALPIWQVENRLRNLLPEISSFTTTLSLNYTTSNFIYRISYPHWSGSRIEHDPTYVAFINPSILISRLPIEVVGLAAITGTIALIVAIYELPKIRRIIF